ncbi:MAG TPA: hypothetical protein DIW17_06900 [Clostridiales bacterium]|nr:hypothetical protein [Clostridiales bacterium]
MRESREYSTSNTNSETAFTNETKEASTVSDGPEFLRESTEISAEVSGGKYGSEVNDYLSNTELMTSQEIAEAAHCETKENMIAEHGECMSDELKDMLESDETRDKLTVMSSEEYTQVFEDVDVNVLGHCDFEGNIYMKDISPEIVKHVSTHETMHLCANRENYYSENGEYVQVSGVREITTNEDGMISDNNQGLNEGLTEMYTMRELLNRGENNAAYLISSYSEARMWSQRMEKLAGKERVEAAYFGQDREGLRSEFNRLNDGNEKAWESFSRDIDLLEYSRSEAEIEQAKWCLMSQYSTMARNKYGIKEF